ncbi:uncharacterized protein LOC116845748 isoform X2 [Odontomachus brunneus]|nr:uncharacterized protein LOC116845748 isoform X2 [Odontomachus brunneus]
MAQLLESKEIKENQIIFSDEAHFWLNGYVNKQNCHFWGQESPQVSLSKPLHLQEVTVWAALSVKGVYIEFLESPITAENYKELLQTKFFPFAKENDLVEKFYFMQDGMTPHRTREVFEAIYEVYEDRVIGLSCPKFFQGGIEWPPYSPDLNPCDFFLWGYIKDNCYSKSPKTKEELIEAIKKVVTDITSECLYNVLYSFHKRVDFCSNSNGAHFGNIYH